MMGTLDPALAEAMLTEARRQNRLRERAASEAAGRERERADLLDKALRAANADLFHERAKAEGLVRALEEIVRQMGKSCLLGHTCERCLFQRKHCMAGVGLDALEAYKEGE